MSRSYYYLVAGLDEPAPDKRAALPSLAAFAAEAAEDLHPDDQALLTLLRFPYDNANLISLLTHPENAFDTRGTFSRETLEQEIKSPTQLPDYMQEFLATRQQASPLTPADRLAWLFYDSVSSHANPFIRAWFEFDLNIRNVLAAMNCRDMAEALQTPLPALLEHSIIGNGSVAEAVRRSSAPDFGVSAVFPEIQEILSLPRQPLAAFERRIDDLRMRVVDEMVFLRGFKVDAVLAHLVKLDIARRWQALDSSPGGEVLDTLVDEIAAGLLIDSGETR